MKLLKTLTAVAVMALGVGLVSAQDKPASPLSSAQAQSKYPTKPVRIIVPSTPAGVLDNVARTLALRLAEQLGQPIVMMHGGLDCITTWS